MQFPPLDKYKGLIFDLDGTLIDSMPYHISAWQEMGKRHGFNVDPKLIYSMGGVSSRDVVLKFRELGFDVGDIDTFIRDKIAIYRKNINKVKTFKSIEAILRQAKKDGKKIAAGSGTQRINAETVLRHTGLLELMDAVITAEDVVNHKPSPDTFLKAAQAIELDRSECVVFEDGQLGIKAAHNGGFDCIEVADGVFKNYYSA